MKRDEFVEKLLMVWSCVTKHPQARKEILAILDEWGAEQVQREHELRTVIQAQKELLAALANPDEWEGERRMGEEEAERMVDDLIGNVRLEYKQDGAWPTEPRTEYLKARIIAALTGRDYDKD